MIDNKLLYPEGCVIKYIIRHSMKNGKEDLLKAKHFIDMIIERDYGDHTYESQVFKSKVDDGTK